jgi:molybdopterin-guanine dinucleotide biosynthesis protein A
MSDNHMAPPSSAPRVAGGHDGLDRRSLADGRVLAALRWAQGQAGAEWLQTAPCDTPFLPKDLVGRLGLHVGAKQAAACVPRFHGELHSTCGLWNVSLLGVLETAIGDGLRGFKEFLDIHPVSVLDWPEPFAGAPDPFFNVNTPAQLQQAERSL